MFAARHVLHTTRHPAKICGGCVECDICMIQHSWMRGVCVRPRTCFWCESSCATGFRATIIHGIYIFVCGVWREFVSGEVFAYYVYRGCDSESDLPEPTKCPPAPAILSETKRNKLQRISY